MTTILLVWYSLGWVACGVNFAAFDDFTKAPLFVCFLSPPVVLLAAMGGSISRVEPSSEQYLWRKP